MSVEWALFLCGCKGRQGCIEGQAGRCPRTFKIPVLRDSLLGLGSL